MNRGTRALALALAALPVALALHALNTPYRAALRALERGDPAAALERLHGVPGHAAAMARGTALYRLGNPAGAAAAFREALLDARDHRRAADALYNMGNAWLRAGGYARAVEAYRGALAHADHARARHNLPFAEAALAAALEKAREARPAGPVHGRMGHGARTARVLEGVPIDPRGSVSIDESSELEFERGPLGPPGGGGAAAGAAAGAVAAGGGAGTGGAARPPVAAARLERARLYQRSLRDQPARLWRSLFEREEGFPGPVERPRPRPGLAPW